MIGNKKICKFLKALFFLWGCMLWSRVEIWENRSRINLDGIWKLAIESGKKKWPGQIKIVGIITKAVGQFKCACSGFIVENIKTFMWPLTSILNYLNISTGKDLETYRFEIYRQNLGKSQGEGKNFVH